MSFQELSQERKEELTQILLFCAATSMAEGCYNELQAIPKLGRKYYKHETRQRINNAYEHVNIALNNHMQFYNEPAMNAENKLVNMMYEFGRIFLHVDEKKREAIREAAYEIAGVKIDAA